MRQEEEQILKNVRMLKGIQSLEPKIDEITSYDPNHNQSATEEQRTLEKLRIIAGLADAMVTIAGSLVGDPTKGGKKVNHNP